MRTRLTWLVMAMLLSTSAQADLVTNFQFSDAAGTGLQSVANSASPSVTWNFNLGGVPGQGATDGAGNLFLGANALAMTSTIDGNATRILDIADVTNGPFRFEYRVSSWDMDDTPGLNTTQEQEGIRFLLRDSANNNVTLTTALNGSDSAFRVRHTTDLEGTNAQANLSLTGTGLLVWAEGNLLTGAYTTGYNDGTGDTILISDGNGLNDIAEIRLLIDGDPDGWAATDSIGLDFVTLDVTAVPEPSAFASFSAALLAGSVARRRCRVKLKCSKNQ